MNIHRCVQRSVSLVKRVCLCLETSVRSGRQDVVVEKDAKGACVRCWDTMVLVGCSSAVPGWTFPLTTLPNGDPAFTALETECIQL